MLGLLGINGGAKCHRLLLHFRSKRLLCKRVNATGGSPRPAPLRRQQLSFNTVLAALALKQPSDPEEEFVMPGIAIRVGRLDWAKDGVNH